MPTMTPTGHLQVVQRAADRRFVALWRDASGKRHKRTLGLAWVKPHGVTARGAVRWRTADGPKPGPEWVTPREAETKLREILALIPPPPKPKSATVTFREAAEDWLRYLEVERERAATTVRDYRNVVRGALFPRFGADRPVNTITTADIDAYREDELRAGRIKRRTLQKNLVLLQGILKRAKRRGWVEYNAAADAERVTFKRSGDFNVLTPTQVSAVSAAAADDLMRTVIVVAAYTGLRMGELRALRWRDVDFAKRSVFVRRNFTGGVEHAPKSGKIRSVPTVDQALVALDAQSRRGEFTSPDDLVFGNAFGEHLYDYTIRNAFYDALNAAGLSALRTGEDPIVFHDLRHTFGTLAVQAFPLTDVKAYMGHEDISTTMIYVHHVPRHDAADKLSALLRSETGPEPAVQVRGSRT
jgi:integrase